MTATQTLKIYEVLGKYFGNQADANIVVTEIEQIVDNKFETKKDSLSTKDDLNLVKLEIKELQISIERRFNQQIIWTIGTGLALAGLMLAILKH